MTIVAEPAHPVAGKNRLPQQRQPGPLAYNGLARRRQQRRQDRKLWLGSALRLGASFWLMMGMLLPVIMHRYTNTQAAAQGFSLQQRPAGHKTYNLSVSASQPSPSPTLAVPVPTATATFVPTTTPTATPLPAHLIQATAWQATLEQAAVYSHATQTQAAGQYAATQTALPPILTANALDRAATATAGVR